jgi:hypothetical protein
MRYWQPWGECYLTGAQEQTKAGTACMVGATVQPHPSQALATKWPFLLGWHTTWVSCLGLVKSKDSKAKNTKSLGRSSEGCNQVTWQKGQGLGSPLETRNSKMWSSQAAVLISGEPEDKTDKGENC